jgi:hypothetical protein
MLKITINNEEVVCDKQLEIKEEMLSTSSCILNNCYPKSWENTKDYTSQYYYPKDYSKCLIYNSKSPRTITQSGTTLTFDDLISPTLQDLQIKGNTYQNTSILPSEYTQVDYIEGHRAEYIDTGFKTTPKTKIETTFQFTQVTPTQQRIFGNYYSETDGLVFTTYINGAGNFAWACQNNTGNWINTGITADTNKHTFIVDSLNNSVSIDNYNATITTTRTNNSLTSILLFVYRYENGVDKNTLSYLKMYSTKIYDNNVLVRDFIPCYRNSDNVVGLYDIVNDVFYTNQGTGAFTYGSVVNIPNPNYPQDVEVVTGEQNIIISQNGNIQNYPINLGNIELCKVGNYQDYIYNQNGDWYLHKEINNYNGSWRLGGNQLFDDSLIFYSLTKNAIGNKAYSTHFSYYNGLYNQNYEGIDIFPNSNEIGIRVNKTLATTVDEFQTWLSNNNVKILYVISIPTDTQITDTTLISQLEAITIAKGNIYVTTENNTLPFDINMTVYDSGVDLLFSGVVKNTGNINLNPRYPHYCSLEVLDFKTFLSECEQLDFVINNKTVSEAIEQVTQAVASYGFVVGNININDDTIIGAYSTQEKTPYDVFQYLADISQSRWYTRLVDENTVAIDFYDPTVMQRGIDLDFSDNTFACENNVEDLSFNYGTYDYRNKQIMLSNQVFGGVDFEETIVADGYNKIFNTTTPIGILKGITVNGSSATFSTNEDKELGLEADFYYNPGQTQIESNENDGTYPANTIIIVGYTPLVKGRQVINNTTEINRIATQTGRNGTISRYEKRNDVLSSDELELIGNSYLKYKGTPEINLTVVTKDVDLYNIGQIVYFNYPNIQDLSKDYMVKSKKTRIINTANDWNIWYTYTLTSNFNSENAINYFDNQRAKSTGNIQAGDYITRNYDIENTANIIWDNLTITEVNVTGANVLNAPLNSPFVE